MITCDYIGGLGNQLFIIFTTISYALDNNKEFYFPYKEYSTPFKVQQNKERNRSVYWNNILKEIKKYILINLDINKIPTLNENKDLKYKKLQDGYDNVCLRGYFQSYKYFKDNFYKIYDTLDINTQKKVIRQNNKLIYDKTISLHIRKGDYQYISNDLILPYKYYKNSIKFLEKLYELNNHIFYIFGEEQDKEHIENYQKLLRKDFPKYLFNIVDYKIPDYEQLLMMSLMNHNIIANSTFSYWGAMFNTNDNKIVLYPSKFYSNKDDYIRLPDLCPYEWYMIYMD